MSTKEQLLEKLFDKLSQFDPEEMIRQMLPIKKTITITTLKDGRICIIIGEKPKEEAKK